MPNNKRAVILLVMWFAVYLTLLVAVVAAKSRQILVGGSLAFNPLGKVEIATFLVLAFLLLPMGFKCHQCAKEDNLTAIKVVSGILAGVCVFSCLCMGLAIICKLLGVL